MAVMAAVCCQRAGQLTSRVRPRGAPPVPIRTRAMSKSAYRIPRRSFLKTAFGAGAAAIAPTIIPSSALGRDGAVPPSERIVMAGIGIGNRGTYDLGCFLQQKDAQFVALCDVKEYRRAAG